MHRAILRPSIIASILAVAGFSAQGQTAVPVKPGLWTVHREVDGQKAPDLSDRLRSMSPERRAQVEAMMKQHGIAVDGGDMNGDMNKVCYTRETLERDPWAEHPGGCKTDFGSRSATSWKWHTTCSQIGYEGDSEATFSNRENYIVRSTSVTKIGGQVRNRRTTITGKWLSDDCGNIKPLQLSR